MKSPFPREEDEEVRGIEEKIHDSEKRLQRWVELRDERNARARSVREEREALVQARRSIVEEVRKLKSERSRILEEAQRHRDLRDVARSKARELLSRKKEIRKKGGPVSYSARARKIREEIERLERKQVTTPMTIAEENKLLETLRLRRKELEEIERLAQEESQEYKTLRELDEKITSLFAQGDAEHRLYEEAKSRADSVSKALEPLQRELDFLSEEIRKKNEEYLKLRSEADEYHSKVLEMRGAVVQWKEKKREIFRERRALIEEQRERVQSALEDETVKEAKVEEALRRLLAQGRIDLS